MNLEQHLIECIDIVDNTQVFEGKQRTLDILSALRGYLSEFGTTWQQDDLLREIVIKLPK